MCICVLCITYSQKIDYHMPRQSIPYIFPGNMYQCTMKYLVNYRQNVVYFNQYSRMQCTVFP